MASAPPGWYPDPSRTSTWRWWDGRQWTAQLYPPPAPHAAAAQFVPAPAQWAQATANQLSEARRSEDRMWNWARLSVWAYAVAAITLAVVFLTLGHAFRDNVRQLYHEIQNNQSTQDTSNAISGWSGWFYLFDLVTVAAGVLFLIWQYHAARAARLLGYPARISPGLGVGSWFIPILNFWFPYWSLRDCLPPTHPLRHLGLWAWLSYLATGVCSTAALTTSFFSVGWAVVPLVLGAAFWLAAALLGTRLMAAIREDHAQAVAHLSSI